MSLLQPTHAGVTPSILRQIADRRRARIRNEGHCLASTPPQRRQVPVVPFGVPSVTPDRSNSTASLFLICEIKRRSPSAGEIAPGLDPLEQAGIYTRAGVAHLSILTEEDHFGGSLNDLMAVKRRFPGLALLRKDFLFDEADLEISYRCGADAILLIAALHDAESLARLCRRAEALGLAPLVEVHDLDDIEKARKARPALTGINSRDLATFRVDRLAPLALKRFVNWDTRLVYESGVRSGEDARLAANAGFSALLVGEAVVRRPSLIDELQAGAAQAAPVGPGTDFWGHLAERLGARTPEMPAGFQSHDGRALRQTSTRPLVKICGLTRAADAERATALGADALGFVFAASPRRAEPALLREVRDLPAFKVGVAVSEEGTRLQHLLNEGLLDAVQLHGDEAPDQCSSLAFPYYKAVRLRQPADVEQALRFRCPRVLADAWSPMARGGTGRRIKDELIEAWAARQPLWLAGGIGPDNVGELVRRFSPELIDASSHLESEPGRKDPVRLERFFRAIAQAAQAARPLRPHRRREEQDEQAG
jgi:indole-3-glycerol phosphate synthase/phosphoribosylanthranilate isomerase